LWASVTRYNLCFQGGHDFSGILTGHADDHEATMINPPAAGPAAAHDILRPAREPLTGFFRPSSVAVIGATEAPGRVGRTILANLIAGAFRGDIFPVNPKRPEVLGLPAYTSIAAVPSRVDLAVIVTPAASVPGVIGECVDAGVKTAIVISAGFRETGPAGVALEEQVRAHLRRGSMRMIGPNCLGVMNPWSGLNATFAAGMARPGNVAFVSQSGALLTAILDWSLRENVGFSAFVSVGSMLDVGWGDLIDHLADDPRTTSIVLYMESIGDARSFLSAAREVSLSKPVIVIKAGRTDAAAKAAASHTGALSGSDDVLDAAFRRSGVLRVQSIAELFYMAGVLSRQPRPKGDRLTILTNAGGPAVLATDALISEGGKLTTLSPPTIEALSEFLPPQWSHGNPVDILGDAAPDRYAKAVETAAADPGSDGLLVVLTPQDMTDPTRTAEQLAPYARSTGKPILASWMGGAGVAAGEDILNGAGIPTFPYPDTAARVFCYMWRYAYNLAGLFETPAPADPAAARVNAAAAGRILAGALAAGRTLLTEFESKQLLTAYRIPTVPTVVAVGEDEAVREADRTGYPAVLKLHSETITHKTDVGGVELNLADAEAVRAAYRRIESAVREKAGPGHLGGVTVQPMVRLAGYELILGSSVDPQFGPVLLFGTGGQLVEVFRDRALALPPLNTTLARRMMEQTRIYTALKGVRGRAPIDLAALEQLLVQFGQLVVDLPRIKEIDINPLVAGPGELIALDARVVLHDPAVPDAALPRPAIRPYPAEYVSEWRMKDGTSVTLRPIRPEDEPLMAKFHEVLSDQTVYQRYLHALKLSQRVAHERLSRLSFIDYDREMAIVAERREPGAAGPALIAVGRLIKLHARDEAEFALVVADRYQGQGLGEQLLRRLLQFARGEGIRRVVADVLLANTAMQRVCQRVGLQVTPNVGDDSLVRAEIEL
jgi:acetyltransferase